MVRVQRGQSGCHMAVTKPERRGHIHGPGREQLRTQVAEGPTRLPDHRDHSLPCSQPPHLCIPSFSPVPGPGFPSELDGWGLPIPNAPTHLLPPSASGLSFWGNLNLGTLGDKGNLCLERPLLGGLFLMGPSGLRKGLDYGGLEGTPHPGHQGRQSRVNAGFRPEVSD